MTDLPDEAPAPSPAAAEKATYYGDPEVVRRYDDWRFGRSGGRYVSQRELDAVLEFLADTARHEPVLDIPVGTGRLAEKLHESGFSHVFAADVSRAMLAVARSRCGSSIHYSRQDAFRMGFASATFGAIVSLRFFFHQTSLGSLLGELARILKPGGCLVFDTLRWSPRAVAPALQRRLGGAVIRHLERDVERMLRHHGLHIARKESIFIFPSLVYRFLPAPLLGPLERVESTLPESLRSKIFWKAVKPTTPC